MPDQDPFDALADAEPVTDPSDDSVGGETSSNLPTRTQRDDTASAACRWCQDEFETISAERLHDCRGRRQARWSIDTDAATIQPHVDELKGFLLYANHGLSPYFGLTGDAADIMIHNDVRFQFREEDWKVESCSIRDGGIDGRPGDVFEKFNEGEIKLVRDDGTEKQHLTLQFAPRFPGMESDGDPIKSVPDDVPEGLNFHVHACMLQPEEILSLIRAWADAVDLNPTYFSDSALSLDHCNAHQVELYVRARRDRVAGTLVGAGGLLDRLQRYSRSHGGTGKARWDNGEITGGNNAITLHGDDCSKLIPGQARGKTFKVYHPKFIRGRDVDREDDPLVDQKFGVSIGREHSASVNWRDLDGVFAELEDALVNCLHWSGLPIQPTPEVYTADDYFEVSDSDRTPGVIEDPTPDLEVAEEQLAVKRALDADLSATERDVLQALTDGGGQQHYQQLAERAGASSSTVYRFYEKMETVLSRVNGQFAFADGVIRDKFEDLMQMLNNAADYVDSSLRATAQRERSWGLEGSPFAKWMRRYGVTVDRDGNSLDLEFTTGRHPIDEVRRRLRAGLEAALATSSHLAYDLIADASVSYRTSEGDRRTVKPYQRYGSTVKVLGHHSVDAAV